MSEHIMVNINGGGSFDVEPQWARDGQSGFCVRPARLDAGEPGSVDEEIVKTNRRCWSCIERWSWARPSR